MQEIRRILREALPEIIGGITVAIVVAIAGLLFTSLGVVGTAAMLLVIAALTVVIVIWRYRHRVALTSSAVPWFVGARSTIVSILEIQIPLLALIINALLLRPEALVDSGFRTIPLLFLVALAILCNLVLRKPYGAIGMTILAANMIAAILLVGLPALEPSRWTLALDSSIFYDGGERFFIMIAVIVLLFTVWTVGVIIVRYFEENQYKSEAELHRLRSAPGIVNSLETYDRQRYEQVKSEWSEFLKVVDSKSRRHGDLLRHCVPFSLQNHVLVLGCKTESDVAALILSTGNHRHPQAAPIRKVQEYARQFYHEPFLEVAVEKIDDSAYRLVEQQLS